MIHAVRRCTDGDCPHMVWHSDVNTCLNILYVFIAGLFAGFMDLRFSPESISNTLIKIRTSMLQDVKTTSANPGG